MEKNKLDEIIEVEPLADVHVHLREGEEIMSALIQHSIAGGADVLGIMPNLTQPLTKAHMVTAYWDMAMRLVPAGYKMQFIPFVMITEETTEKDIDACINAGIVDGKVYPFLRTTKSESGVKRYGRILPIIKYCGEAGMKCHFHPEHPSMTYSNRDAEYEFLPIARIFLEETNTKIIWEHGTDARCIPHWKDFATRTQRFFVTLTAHHLFTNEDKTFGDVRAICKPSIKTEQDRQGLLDLVEEDFSWVMAGTDSAWHPKGKKHVDRGCCACGSFTAPNALTLYFRSLGKFTFSHEGRQIFNRFTSGNARKLHGLQAPSRKVKFVRDIEGTSVIPDFYPVGSQEEGLPFGAGEQLFLKMLP